MLRYRTCPTFDPSMFSRIMLMGFFCWQVQVLGSIWKSLTSAHYLWTKKALRELRQTPSRYLEKDLACLPSMEVGGLKKNCLPAPGIRHIRYNLVKAVWSKALCFALWNTKIEYQTVLLESGSSARCNHLVLDPLSTFNDLKSVCNFKLFCGNIRRTPAVTWPRSAPVINREH